MPKIYICNAASRGKREGRVFKLHSLANQIYHEKGKITKSDPSPPSLPFILHSPIPSGSHTAALAYSSLHCVSNHWLPLLPFIFYFVSYIFGGILALVMFSFTALSSSLSSLLSFSSSLLSSLLLSLNPSILTLGLSEVWQVCHGSLRHSLNLLTFVLEITPLTVLSLPARIDKMRCDYATLPASSQLPLSWRTTDLRLGCGESSYL